LLVSNPPWAMQTTGVVVDWDEETETTATERVLKAEVVAPVVGPFRPAKLRTGSTGRRTRAGFNARGSRLATFPLLASPSSSSS
jgi:hypothetical protein